jgi:peptidoglycan hydrolase CwlO-like protein
MGHLHQTTQLRTPRAAPRARRLTGVVAALIVAACLAAATPRAAAAPSLSALQREAKRTRAQMAQLQRRLQQAGDDLAGAQARLDGATRRLQTARFDLARAQQNLDLQWQVLANRAALLYKTGGFDWLDIIANLQSLSDIDTIRALEKALAEQDLRNENKAQLLARQARQLEQQVETDREDALVAEQRVQDRKASLDQALAQRAAILQDVTERIKKILASGGLAAALRMASNGEFTQFTWAQALLVAMRLPVTADNVAAIAAWEMAEGGHWYNSARYNPLNTTQDMPGAAAFNSVGVKAYASWKQGLQATVKTLKNGNYGAIIAALKRGRDSAAVAHAVGASPWGTGDFSRLL